MTQKIIDRSAIKPLLDAGWEILDGRDAIVKTFKFKSFRHAWAWMSHVALWAEKIDHHPEWSNTYNRVEVLLITHSCDGLSDLDIKLAQEMEMASSF